MRLALHGKHPQRVNNALTTYSASVRVACAAAFLEARLAQPAGSNQGAAVSAAAAAESALVLARSMLAACPAAASRIYARFVGRVAHLTSALRNILGPCPDAMQPHSTPEPLARQTAPLHLFEHSSHMFIASLATGWSLSDAISLWAPVQSGSFSASGKSFYPGPRTPQQQPTAWAECEVRPFPRGPGEPIVHVHIL